MASIPGPEVLEAFRLSGSAVPLPGGEGRSVRVGDAVLKPVDDPEFADWLAETMSGIVEDGFRVGRPLRTSAGAWRHDGWTASCYVPGAEPDHVAHPRWLEIVEAGRAFHRALATVPRPAFLDRRANWWQTGDYVAWQEQQPDVVPCLQAAYDDLVALMARVAEPVRRAPQLIHGDLTGNVLFAAGLAPAVIDFSPYWRPAAFGEAVVVGDALIWHGAGVGLVGDVVADRGPGFLQFIVRAVVYRLVTTSERVRSQAAERSAATAFEVGRYEGAARLLADFAGQ